MTLGFFINPGLGRQEPTHGQDTSFLGDIRLQKAKFSALYNNAGPVVTEKDVALMHTKVVRYCQDILYTSRRLPLKICETTAEYFVPAVASLSQLHSLIAVSVKLNERQFKALVSLDNAVRKYCRWRDEYQSSLEMGKLSSPSPTQNKREERVCDLLISAAMEYVGAHYADPAREQDT